MALFGTKKTTKKKEKGASAVVKSRRVRSTKSVHGSGHDVLLAPWFSEKALIATERGVYVFAVPARATKASIAGAVKEIYNVEPRKIRVVHLPGKTKNLRSRRGTGARAARHKAYVYLNAGDTIQFA